MGADLRVLGFQIGFAGAQLLDQGVGIGLGKQLWTAIEGEPISGLLVDAVIGGIGVSLVQIIQLGGDDVLLFVDAQNVIVFFVFDQLLLRGFHLHAQF